MTVRHSRVVVGCRALDVSPLAWAFAEAGRRSADLDVVHAWTSPFGVPPDGLPDSATDPTPYEAHAKQLLDEAIAAVPPRLRAAVPTVQPVAVRDRPSPALLDACRNADLLVVGTRGSGAVTGLLGSVSHQCVHHAACPVVVVPPTWPTDRFPSRIAVGVDGSEGSAVALNWALQEAARWESAVTVIHSWATPYPVEPWGMVVTPRSRDQFVREARELIDNMVDSAVAGGCPRPNSLTSLPVEDASGPALVQASADTDLLVMGSRGRGGFAALLLGSTSVFCLNHAHCPVVAVPRPR